MSSSLPRSDQLDDSSCTPCPTEPSDYAPLFSPAGMSTGECWQWPSEISNTMEWSAQFLNPAYMTAQSFPGADGEPAADAHSMMAQLGGESGCS